MKLKNVLRQTVIDILAAGLILCVFAYFHHVRPYMMTKKQASAVDEAQTEIAQETPSPSPSPNIEENIAAIDTETASEETENISEEVTPIVQDTRTEWQIKFEDKFTDEVIITDNSYTSPYVSVSIDTVEYGENYDKVTYYVADIYIASIDNFTTYVANNDFSYFSTQDAVEMNAAAEAILSISGDFCTYQASGFLARNGNVYMTDYTYCDICVLYDDGTMECYDVNSYNIDDILSRGVLQVWNFGPSLLNDEGKVKSSYTVSTTVSYINPRSAVGYYEPGHYCFVVVDGRQEGYSKGMYIDELAEVFQNLGCRCAYNLDGGGSAVMIFNGERYSRQSNGGDRKLGDILLIRDTENYNG